MAPMPANLTFNLTWKNADANAYVHKVVNGNIILDHPAINHNPSANFYAAQVWNPGGTGGVYNTADITLIYNKQVSKWEIKNQNGTLPAEGSAYNILIISANGGKENQPTINSVATETRIDYPGTNNNSTRYPNTNEVNDLTGIIKALNEVNLSFEGSFLNWKATGNAFSNQPVQQHTVTTDRVQRQMNYASGGIGGDYWKGMPYNIGSKGNNWIGSFENGNGETAVGTLTSHAFKTAGSYLHFLLGGNNDINKIYVELQVKREDYEAAWGAGKRGLWGVTDDGYVRVERITPLVNGEDLYRYWFDLGALLNRQQANKTIRVQVVDNSNRGHINTDDFQFSDEVNSFILFMKGGYSLYADKDKPVWGFADTHAHWVNHVGLKGLMHGTPGGKLETSDVRTDIPPCDGFNHNQPSITPGILLAQLEPQAFKRFGERLADPGNAICAGLTVITSIPFALAGNTIGCPAHATLDGTLGVNLYSLMFNPAAQVCAYPLMKDLVAKHYNNSIPNTSVGNYVDYPRWNTQFHQQMHISWVKRSYDGGQRLMVVQLGVAKSWEYLTTSEGTMGSAKRHIEDAVAEIERIVALNPGWLQIAKTPTQAREIILSNKMAIVLGIEQAEIGNYFESADAEIEWLQRLGITYAYPVHNINNKIGGAAVFNSALNSYNDLVNRSSQHDTMHVFKIRDGETDADERNGTYTNFKLDRMFMRQGIRHIPLLGLGNIPFFHLNDVPLRYDYESSYHSGHKNAEGLSNRGRMYIRKLMQRGFVVDVDHMSDLTRDEVLSIAKTNSYPVISGHSNFRRLRSDGFHGTTAPERMRTEFTIHDNCLYDIVSTGGMFGLMTQQNDVVQHEANCPVPNKAAGSSSSFAQSYWYVLQKTSGLKGIAFGTDCNGFAPQIAPRFGVDVGAVIEGDPNRNIQASNTGAMPEDNTRRRQAFQQKKGVRYDSPINTWHYHRFLKPSFLTSEEREVWEGLAIAKSSNSIDAVNNAWQPGGGLSVERTGLQQDKIANFARGFWWGIHREPTGDYGAYLECPGYVSRIEELNNCMPERKAAYLCVRGLNSLPEHMKTTRTMELYRVLKPIYDLWMEFENGPNEPLRRSYAYTGGRDFDFNLDGLAHYGMLPDLIQDMKNQGLTTQHLKPLFGAAEEYIKMWEKAERTAASVR
jgi:microsomal dipeptidase-like Zn-dependent dipeptidase